MKMASIYSKTLAKINDRFPKLNAVFSKSGKLVKLSGDLDICDVKGVYWDTFKVEILIPDKFPYAVPEVFELSYKIPRENDRHISENGLCCLDMEHKLLRQARRGINLYEFIEKIVYPFFANQLYYEIEGRYANEEYPHGFKGVQLFYSMHLNLHESNAIIRILKAILKNELPGRNDLCPCQSGRKIKFCHKSEIDFLKSVGEARLIKDLEEFMQLTTKINMTHDS